MTAKRFKLVEYLPNVIQIKDNNQKLNGHEIVDLLNKLAEENEQLKTDNGAFIQDIEVFKEANTHLKLENEQLKSRCNDYDKALKTLQDLTDRKLKENEQLNERNNRQAKQLDNLYRLIEQKDWRTLTDIMDDFKRCEEQLQRESGTYW